MKREQGVRDPVGAGVVHGRATLDRRCISFKRYMYAGHSTADGRQHSHLTCAMCSPSILPSFPPPLSLSSSSSSSSSLTSVLSQARHFSTLLYSSPAQSVIRRKESFEQTFLPVDYMYMPRLLCSIQMTMRKILERREVSSLYWYPNYRPSSLRSGLLTLPFPLNTPQLRINRKPNSILLFPFLGASH